MINTIIGTLVQQQGVPQGSTLGPLFINNVPLICSECCVQLYAVATVIYTSKTNLLQIESVLQFDFNILQQWLTADKLLLSKTKSHTMIFGNRQSIKVLNPNL